MRIDLKLPMHHVDAYTTGLQLHHLEFRLPESNELGQGELVFYDQTVDGSNQRLAQVQFVNLKCETNFFYKSYTGYNILHLIFRTHRQD